MADRALLEAHDIALELPDMTATRSFGRRPMVRILHPLSLCVHAGEAVGIVGESGSGKSSLGRTLLRLAEPTAGRLIFDGIDITYARARTLRPLRRRMQMIFQNPLSSLNPRHRIGTILAAALGSRDTVVAANALAEVALDAAMLRRYPHELSGGQRQRVGIARALATDPDFVLADEIVSGLDISTQAQVLALLRDLVARRGVALAFISHDLAVIRNLCDRVVVMRRGRIVEDGPCRQIFEAPGDPYTRALLDAIPPAWPDPAWFSRTGSRL